MTDAGEIKINDIEAADYGATGTQDCIRLR